MVKVRICCGTACFVMGGSDLLLIREKLSEEENSKISVTFEPCLRYCKEKGKNPPFVVIDGEVYEKMTVEKLVSVIKKKIGGKENAGAQE